MPAFWRPRWGRHQHAVAYSLGRRPALFTRRICLRWSRYQDVWQEPLLSGDSLAGDSLLVLTLMSESSPLS